MLRLSQETKSRDKDYSYISYEKYDKLLMTLVSLINTYRLCKCIF